VGYPKAVLLLQTPYFVFHPKDYPKDFPEDSAFTVPSLKEASTTAATATASKDYLPYSKDCHPILHHTHPYSAVASTHHPLVYSTSPLMPKPNPSPTHHP
jgi:hypothetical protein